MQIFCINLPESTDRRRLVNQQFQSLALSDWEWLEAVNGRTLSAEEMTMHTDTKYQQRGHNRIFFPGEVGCALSHQKAYKAIIDRGLSHALILEDDICIDRNLKLCLSFVEHLISEQQPQVILLSEIKKYFSDNIQPISDQYDLVEAVSARHGYAYIINRKAAEIIIKNNYPLKHVADDWKRVRYFSDGDIVIKAVVPPLVGVGHLATTSQIIQSDTEKAYAGRKRKKRRFYSRLMTARLKLTSYFYHFFRKVEAVSQQRRMLIDPIEHSLVD